MASVRTRFDGDDHAGLERQILGDQSRVVDVHTEVVAHVMGAEPLHRLPAAGHRSGDRTEGVTGQGIEQNGSQVMRPNRRGHRSGD